MACITFHKKYLRITKILFSSFHACSDFGSNAAFYDDEEARNIKNKSSSEAKEMYTEVIINRGKGVSVPFIGWQRVVWLFWSPLPTPNLIHNHFLVRNDGTLF